MHAIGKYRHYLLGLLCFMTLSLSALAQEDSIRYQLNMPELNTQYGDHLYTTPAAPYGALIEPTGPMQNFQRNWNAMLAQPLNGLSFTSMQLGRMPGSLTMHPFISNVSINSMAVYSLNDKLQVGGNSFSASSIFDPIHSQFDPSKMNMQGFNLFLEYKVSDKFSIGGSIQVNQHKSPF